MRSLGKQHGWMRCLHRWLCVCLWVPISASAVSEIRFSAEAIDFAEGRLNHASAHVKVGAQQQLQIDADSLQIGEATLYQPKIALNLTPATQAQVTTLEVRSDRVETARYQAKSAKLMLALGTRQQASQFSFDAAVKANSDAQWGSMHLQCDMPNQSDKLTWRCANGLYQDVRSHIPFRIDVTPNTPVQMTTQTEQNVAGLKVTLNLEDARFSDVTGLHAGEKLNGRLLLSAVATANGWQWLGEIDWQSGALFWQPFYFAEGNKRFVIRGRYQPPYLDIDHAELDLPGIGQLTSQSRIDLKDYSFSYLKVDGREVDFAGVYGAFIQPLLTNSTFGQLAVSGKADWSFEAVKDHPQRFLLNIKDANVADARGKFAFKHFYAQIPWDYDAPTAMRLGYQSGQVLNMPLGTTDWQAQLNRYAITAPNLRLPILDGALEFGDVSAAWIQQHMVWHLHMDMQPISLASFSQAMGWPKMRGQIDGHIPLVSYANRTLRMDGEMYFDMFNGKIAMSGLEMQDPLGETPTLQADLQMRNIDLGEITRTFNFGAITGKLEGDVKHLKLLRWKPVYMDANIQTADGDYPKTISPRAVENITALGGEGTAKALQRTVLRFFNAFDYEKIGIQCALRGDVCQMGGVASTPQGFVILKGKGIPAVNVNGYTEYVSWRDILSRMQRITDSNSKVVIQ